MKVIKTLLLIIGFCVIAIFVYIYLQDEKQNTNPVEPPRQSTAIITSPINADSSKPSAPTEEQKREAIAVKNWLAEKRYRVSKSDNTYKIKGPGGTLSISSVGYACGS